MTAVSPTLGMKGIWYAIEPFELSNTVIYTCTAIRTFEEFEREGDSVFESVYQPAGLTEDDHLQDHQAGAVVITLKSDTLPSVVIPTTYLQRYPDLDYVEYERFILSIDLGPLPVDLSLEHLKSELGHVASEVLGFTPEVKEHVLSNPTVYSREVHDQITTAREDAISNRTSIHVKYAQAQELIRAQADHIRALEEKLQETQPGT